MQKVDLICNPELLPRLRLLAQHMRSLQVRLRLHTEMPAKHTPQLIIAASAKHPIEIDRTNAEEIIGLYLESKPALIDADYHIHIPTWPARSSDPDVAALATYLITRRSERAKPGTRTTSRANAARSTQQKREQRRNRVVLSFLLALILGLILMPTGEQDTDTDTDTEKVVIEESAQFAKRPDSGVSTRLPEASPVDTKPSTPEAVIEPFSTTPGDAFTPRDNTLIQSTPRQNYELALPLPTRSTLPWPTEDCPVDHFDQDQLQRLESSCIQCRADPDQMFSARRRM